MRATRRDFLRTGFFGMGVGTAMPFVFEHSALAMAAEGFYGGPEGTPEKILVVVEMAGGNDGLNTLVPFRNDIYYKSRPTLAIKKDSTLKLNDDLGLHPSMRGLKRMWDEGKMAVVQGCGYPNPNLSHFTSMEYWHTAAPDGVESLGWVGRFADAQWREAKPSTIVNVSQRQSLAVQSARHAPVVFSKTDDDASGKVRAAVESYRTPISYGSESISSTLSTDLKKVAALINAGFPTRIYYVSMGGFDTHAGQATAQTALLMYVADAIEGFMNDVKRTGHAAEVAMMMFTEFGRRVAENQSGGTDHGTATPMYIFGEKVKAGLYGAHPNLADLDSNGDLKMTTDFRRVYATMMREWMGFSGTSTVLRGDFETLGVFA